jgi:hypothetical protein
MLATSKALPKAEKRGIYRNMKRVHAGFTNGQLD